MFTFFVSNEFHAFLFQLLLSLMSDDCMDRLQIFKLKWNRIQFGLILRRNMFFAKDEKWSNNNGINIPCFEFLIDFEWMNFKLHKYFQSPKFSANTCEQCVKRVFFSVMHAKRVEKTSRSNFKSDKWFSLYFLMNFHLLFLTFSRFIYRRSWGGCRNRTENSNAHSNTLDWHL